MSEDTPLTTILERLDANLRDRKEIQALALRARKTGEFLNEGGFPALVYELNQARERIGATSSLDAADFAGSSASDEKTQRAHQLRYGVLPLNVMIKAPEDKWSDLVRQLNIDPRIDGKRVRGEQLEPSIFGLKKQAIDVHRHSDEAAQTRATLAHDTPFYAWVNANAEKVSVEEVAAVPSYAGLLAEYRLVKRLTTIVGAYEEVESSSLYDLLDKVAQGYERELHLLAREMLFAEEGDVWADEEPLIHDSHLPTEEEANMPVELGKEEDWRPEDHEFGSAMPIDELERLLDECESYKELSEAIDYTRQTYSLIINDLRGDIYMAVDAALRLRSALGTRRAVPLFYAVMPTSEEIGARQLTTRDHQGSPLRAIIAAAEYVKSGELTPAHIDTVLEKKGYL